ncbi:DUF3848 domain-containing protein [Dehalobacterium formicoaceticum]|uniref:DUF3848 domain-containing protein n=1 Tax=Dehalobacterium formicoaceticum TaxID=51515 RepID=UPI0031F62217
MIDNSSKDILITREMIEDKMDAEFQTFTESVPAGQRDSAFETKLEVLAQIRDALYVIPIPDELKQSVFDRECILEEVYLFWQEETSRDTPNVDRFALPYECASYWLNGVHYEYRNALLYERLAADHEAFIAEERQKTPDEIIEDAWKITCMADLLMALENEDLEPQDVDALLTMEHPLHVIYDEYLSKDSESHMYALIDTAVEVAQARHNDIMTKNIHLTSGDTVTKQRIEDYLKVYGEPEQEPALKKLRLDDRSLTYSEVELTGNGQTTSFLTGGIPDTYTIDEIEQYQEFAEGLPPLTEITVAVSSWCIGCGESEAAADDELAVIEENQDLLEQQYGIDPLQSEHFTEITPDDDLDFDEEPDDGLEP